ncbi:MAG: adenylate/guanylate cyclase domain-containing protein [Treponema sp.]|jgi:adenylate cyclase|nr:adenylate/guanylate cyclase domain-containing protein [Treponema sp.]
MSLWKNALTGFVVSAAFVLVFLAGILSPLDDWLYDSFLRFRSDRPRIENVVFLDVDDAAIAYNGFFPWPRSIPADGLLRLKEYGVTASVFDIEYIDNGPQGVDSLYLNSGLGNDFDRSFSEISSAVTDVLSALRAGRLGRGDIDDYALSLSTLIGGERESLYARAQGVARDNDLYLAQAIALFGKSWMTLNLRESPLDGEQAERRPFAQEHFSYPVNAASGAHFGGGFVDVLPPLPAFARAAKGAGFTNIEIDNDGVRRRIYLAQKIQDHWYVQLAFAPLLDYLGRPEVQLAKNKLTIKNAQLGGGKKKDIDIPLDNKGRMMLDWPKEDFIDSYSHISFAEFSLMDEIEAEIEKYSRALAAAELNFFVQFDSSLIQVPIILADMGLFFDAVHTEKNRALENVSEEAFADYLEYRDQGYALLAQLLESQPADKIRSLSSRLSAEYPESAELIKDASEYITQLINALEIDLQRWHELDESNRRMLRDKFCSIGRVDTGTTDYGANPFYGKYVNVGTHGVVLDTIISETFIVPVGTWLNVLFMLIFVPLFFVASMGLSPVPRFAAGFAATAFVISVVVALLSFVGIFFAPAGIVLAMITAVITREIISYAGSEKEKHFIRSAFSTYVSHDVVKEIIADPSRLQLGGTKRHMTAIFTDIAGFSTISEKLDPEDLVRLLNRYLSAMSDVILGEKGTIDKYEGDAIIAFFGAPIELKDHALRACVSAIAMKKIEAELNKTIVEQNHSPSPLSTRIGINSGEMVAGNMGTENKMNYTIMGNAVNLAARLEGVNKQYGTSILASEETVLETGDHLLVRKLERVRVVGINEPVRLYELLDLAEHATDTQKKLVQVFHDAQNYFEQKNWKQAADAFSQFLSFRPDDIPSKKYFDRSCEFISKPPDDDWDGVTNLTSK